MTTPNNTVAGLAETWRDIASRLGELECPTIAELARAETYRSVAGQLAAALASSAEATPNPMARYWMNRAEFWMQTAISLGWREVRDAANGEAPSAIPANLDLALVADILEVAGCSGMMTYKADSILEQARLCREADNAEAAGIRTVNRSPSVAGDAGGLPELPEAIYRLGGTEDTDGYDADQMRAYGEQCRLVTPEQPIQWDGTTRTMQEHLYVMTGERDRYRMFVEQQAEKVARLEQRIAEQPGSADELAAWHELADHVRSGATNSIWPDRYTDDAVRDVAQRLRDTSGSAVQGENLTWALEQGGILADWCNVAGGALRSLLDVYERRVRSSCTTEADLASEPWRCAEYVQAEQALKTKPSPSVEITTPPPAPAADPFQVPKLPGNWPEDASQENGNYECKCWTCGMPFYGHKRRVVCKVCAPAEAPAAEQGDALAEQYRKGWEAGHATAHRIRNALATAPSGVRVDDAMVGRAMGGYAAICRRDGQDEDFYPDAMRAALIAALAGKERA